MKTMITIAALLTSLKFTSSTHPMMMSVLLIVLTLLISPILFSWLSTAWYSYILILAFLGGMMILFIYISSLIPNEIVTPKSSMLAFILPLMLLPSMKYPGTYSNIKSIMGMLSSWKILYFLMGILLFILLMVMKMTLKPHAPLKSAI